MARMSGRQLELLRKEQEDMKLRQNAVKCANFVMQRLELETDQFGFINYLNEDTDELSEFTFDGKKCKDICSGTVLRKNELPFDPYNNIKLCCGLLQYYINAGLGRDTTMMYLSNKNMNEAGELTVVLEDGTKITGNTYNKDTLKYIDMLLILDRALALDFAMLKGFDI
jgi:hypothetical protein